MSRLSWTGLDCNKAPPALHVKTPVKRQDLNSDIYTCNSEPLIPNPKPTNIPVRSLNPEPPFNSRI